MVLFVAVAIVVAAVDAMVVNMTFGLTEPGAVVTVTCRVPISRSSGFGVVVVSIMVGMAVSIRAGMVAVVVIEMCRTSVARSSPDVVVVSWSLGAAVLAGAEMAVVVGMVLCIESSVGTLLAIGFQRVSKATESLSQ